MNPFASLENLNEAFRILHEIVPGLPADAWISFEKQPTVFRPDWPWELVLSMNGRQRWNGGQMARGIGDTPEEAWANLQRALG